MDTTEKASLVSGAVDAVGNVSAVTREAPVSSLKRWAKFLNTHDPIREAQKYDDILTRNC